ncbi:MAG: TolC family protein [Tannerellaceae bacterium]
MTYRLVGFLLIGSACWGSAAAQLLSLEVCQEQAKKNYPYVRQYELIEKSRAFSLSNASKAYLPQLGISGYAVMVSGIPTIALPNMPAQKASNHQVAGVARVDQAIWDGGATHAQRKMIEAGAQVEVAQNDVSMYALRQRVNEIYFGILTLEQQQKQLRLQEATLAANLKRVEAALANGAAFRSDVDEVRASMLDVEQQLLTVTNTQKAYMRMLAYMTGLEVNEGASFEQPAVLNTDVALPDLPISRPELTLFENNKAQISSREHAIKAALMPRVGVFAQAIYTTPGIHLLNQKLDHLLLGGLSVSWNLGALYTRKNDLRQIENDRNKVDVQQANFLYNLRLGLISSQMQMHNYMDLMRNDDEIVALRKRIRESFEVKYANGVITTSDLLRSINNEGNARIEKDIHHIQFIYSQYQIEFATGRKDGL